MLKKFLLSLALTAAVSGSAMADAVSIVMSDYWGATDCDLSQWTQAGFTFTPEMGENPKEKIPVYKQKNEEVRFYALNTLTISAPADGAPMTRLVFTLSKQGREEQAVITPSTGEVEQQSVGNSSISWTGSASVLTLTVGETNSLHTEGIADGSGQFDFVKIDIFTGESEIEKPADTDTEFYMCNAVDNDGILSEWTQGNLRFSATKGEDDDVNDPALKNGEEARFYAGNSFTISTIDGREISSIEFMLSEQGFEQQAAVTPSDGTMTQEADNNAEWNGTASSITFSIGGNEYGSKPSKKGQFDFTQINIRYKNTATVTPVIGSDQINTQVEYYTLQGIKVENPSTGIYIRHQGSDAMVIRIR